MYDITNGECQERNYYVFWDRMWKTLCIYISKATDLPLGYFAEWKRRTAEILTRVTGVTYSSIQSLSVFYASKLTVSLALVIWRAERNSEARDKNLLLSLRITIDSE